MKTIINWFKAVCVGAWILGILTVNPHLRNIFWSIPATYGATMVIAVWWYRKKYQQTGVSIDSRKLTPEQREKMDEAMKMMAEAGGIELPDDFGKKCDNPHCEGCHPELNNENKTPAN